MLKDRGSELVTVASLGMYEISLQWYHKAQANKTLLCGNYLLRKMNKIILFMSLKLFPKMGVCLEKILVELKLVK